MTQAAERRSFEMEVRAAGRGLSGRVALFGTVARVGGTEERIAPGAFKDSLARNPDILALADHDPARVLGRTRSGTLRLTEDARGLSFDLDLPETQAGRDILALAERGDLGGMSFGFRVPKGGDHWEGNRRELRAIDLREISVVSAWPAYPKTSVTARSAHMASPLARYARLILGGGTWG